MKIFQYLRDILQYVFGTPGGKIIKNLEHSQIVCVKATLPVDNRGSFNPALAFENEKLFFTAYMQTPYSCLIQKLVWYEYVNETIDFFVLETQGCFLSKDLNFRIFSLGQISVTTEKDVSGQIRKFLNIRDSCLFKEIDLIPSSILTSALLVSFTYQVSTQTEDESVSVSYAFKIPLQNILSMEFLFQ